MKNTNNVTNIISRNAALAVVAGIALLLGTAGCNGAAKKKQVSHGERFAPPDMPRSINKFADAQISSGARTDATLRAYHFDGGQLNSLGRDKLRAMMKDDDACEPLLVYVDVKGNANSRREAVSAFLTDEGLLESQVQLKGGPNLDNSYPAARGLKAFAASESGAQAAIGADGDTKGLSAGSDGLKK